MTEVELRFGDKKWKIEYRPRMLACDYLRHVIVPTAGLRLDRAQVSVLETVKILRLPISGERPVTFGYANRLDRMETLIPIDNVSRSIIMIGALSSHTRLLYHGNASRADARADCSMCLEKGSNFTLSSNHRFHDVCLCMWRNDTCPLCRKAYPFTEKARLQASVVDGVREGRLPDTLPVFRSIMGQP